MNQQHRNLQYYIMKMLQENESCELANMAKELNTCPSLIYQSICALNEGNTIIHKIHKASGDTSFSLTKNKNIRCSIPGLEKAKFELPKNQYSVKFVIFADNHIGRDSIKITQNNKYLLDEHCDKNNIHNAIHGGDFVFESKSKWNNYRFSPEIMLETVKELYPTNNNVKTFLAFGNHDVTFAKELKNQLNLLKSIQENRYDIHAFDENGGKIQFGNDQIFIRHRLTDTQGKHYCNTNEFKIIIQAHSHYYHAEMFNNCLIIKTPAYSSLNPKSPRPSFLEIEIYYEKNQIYDVTIKEISKRHTHLEEQYTRNFTFEEPYQYIKKATG